MSAQDRQRLLGERHAFGARLGDAPTGVARPVQVHGTRVVCADSGEEELGEADAVFATRSGVSIGIVTADCVPVLVRAESGAAAAIHAGWRGLAAGVLEAGIAALRETDAGALRAVVGPCASSCCYEVDAPVLDALAERYGAAVEDASIESRPGHALLDLGGLALHVLARTGIAEGSLGRIEHGCTICHSRSSGGAFESVRSDGEAAGRMLHWITAG